MHQIGLRYDRFTTVNVGGPNHRIPHCKALDRTITFQDMPVELWRDELLKRGLPGHLVNHLATNADLYRAGRYDRMSDDVYAVTQQQPLRMQEFARNNAATFIPSPNVA